LGIGLSTKEDIKDQINEVLSLDLDWSRMSKEDLEKLLNFVRDPYNLIKTGVKNVKGKVKKELMEEILGRPLLEELLSQTSTDESSEDKGPFGLGIIPRIRGFVKGVGP
jgi:hypothetical protein